jgi:insulysin
MWWKLERSYHVPAIFAGVKFETAVNMKSLRQETLLRVFNEYIGDALHEKLQPSFEAGFKMAFDSNMRGMTVEMYGWSDKFEQFYTDILETVNSKPTAE